MILCSICRTREVVPEGNAPGKMWCASCLEAEERTSAVKHDAGKSEFHLIPWRPLAELGNLYAFGATKYAPNNWKKGMKYSRVYNAMLRHLAAWWEGETLDEEHKCHHLASVAWCAFTLMWYDFTGEGEDDRP